MLWWSVYLEDSNCTQFKCSGMNISAWTNSRYICVGWWTYSLLFVIISFISIWNS